MYYNFQWKIYFNVLKMYHLNGMKDLPKSVQALIVLHPMHMMLRLTMFEQIAVVYFEPLQSHCTVQHPLHHRFLHNDQLIMDLKCSKENTFTHIVQWTYNVSIDIFNWMFTSAIKRFINVIPWQRKKHTQNVKIWNRFGR